MFQAKKAAFRITGLLFSGIILFGTITMTGCERKGGTINGPINSRDHDEDNGADSEEETQEDEISSFRYIPTEEDKAYRNNGGFIGWSYVARNSSYIFYSYNSCITRMTADHEEETVVFEGNSPGLYLIDDKLYFSSDRDGTIYSSDMNGDNVNRIISDEVESFFVNDDYIYYFVAFADQGNGLYRTDTDGQNRIQIAGEYAGNACVSDDFIVYFNTETNEVYKADLDGQNSAAVYKVPGYDSLSEIRVYKGNIYLVFDYADDMNICGINLLDPATGELINIVRDSYASNVFFWDDKVYYYSGDLSATVYYDLNGDTAQVTVEGQTYASIVLGDMLYTYADSGDGIFEFNLNSPEKSRVIESTVYSDIGFTNDSLYLVHAEDNCIYKNTPGTEETIKVLSDDEYWYFFGKDGNLYFYTENGFCLLNENDTLSLLYKDVYGSTLFDESRSIYREDNGDIYCSTSGNESYLLMKDTESNSSYTPVLLDGEWLYYEYWANEVTLYNRFNINDKTNELIYEDETASRDIRIGPLYYRGRLYYDIIDEDFCHHLYSMNPDESNKALLSDAEIDFYSIRFADDYIIYKDSADHRIYRMNPDGSNVKKLTGFPCEAFAIDEENKSIYYINCYEDGDIYRSDYNGEELMLTLDVNN